VLDIIYHDDFFIAINKAAGLPVIPDKTNDPSAQSLLEIDLSTELFPVNRLDRPASGIVIFGKSSEWAAMLSRLFKERKVLKTYLAIVKKRPDPEAGKLTDHLEKRNNKAYIVKKKKKGKSAELIYRTIGRTAFYHVLEIELITGRFHQIRAQLANIGCPIKGDVKYGARRSNMDRSIHLHARTLVFTHPKTMETVHLTAPLPADPVWDHVNGIL
jgi:23S rRNA pseudouridine1911/1915/1917 synthase